MKRKFGRAVMEKRYHHGLHQYQLAKALNLDPSVLSRIETGNRNATPEIAAALVRYFKSEHLGKLYCSECPVSQAINEAKTIWLKQAA